jgi:hypothetical protein
MKTTWSSKDEVLQGTWVGAETKKSNTVGAENSAKQYRATLTNTDETQEELRGNYCASAGILSALQHYPAVGRIGILVPRSFKCGWFGWWPTSLPEIGW